MTIDSGQHITPLARLRSSDARAYGGKAATLGELLHLGCRVPPGFAISSALWQEARNGARPLRVPEELHRVLLDAFDGLHVRAVAVRSSAIGEDAAGRTWAGQFATKLGVTRATLIEAIEEVWQSPFRAQVQAYATTNGLDPYAGVGVIVQALVESDFSGVGFSIDPVTGDQGTAVLEAVAGLGEVLVNGRVTPDTYHVDKGTLSILRGHQGTQDRQLAADAEGTTWVNHEAEHVPVEMVLDAARMVCDIEAAFGYPVDVEWTFGDDMLFVLQARAITAAGRGHSDRAGSLLGYTLSFVAKGVSVLATDVHMRIYGSYEVVMLQVDGQYEKWSGPNGLAQAAAEGAAFLSDSLKVDALRSEAQAILGTLVETMKEAALRGDLLSSRQSFFRESDRFMTVYKYFNSEFVDMAFVAAPGNESLLHGLKLVTDLKNPLRSVLNAVYFDPSGPLATLVSGLATHTGRSEEDLYSCTSAELLSLAIPASPQLATRRSAYAELLSSDRLVVLSGSDAVRLRQTAVPPTNGGLRGTVSNAPVTRFIGAAYVLDVDFADLPGIARATENMPAGAILVCRVTGPEITEACAKAGAIVNEIGGLLSHAAIISRELGLPCIVGIVGLSSAIRTGDLLELDLVEGHVSIVTEATTEPAEPQLE